MERHIKHVVHFFMLFFLLTGCRKNERVCDPVSIITTTVASDSCIDRGKIVVTSPSGADVHYRVGTNSFQSSPEFSLLLAGNHFITVKTADKCETTVSVVVHSTDAGPLFLSVKNVLAAHCATCHSGNNPQAGNDWTQSCDIVTKWDRIKARAVDGIPSPMPTAGLIPVSERQKIIDWINAGHRYTD